MLILRTEKAITHFSVQAYVCIEQEHSHDTLNPNNWIKIERTRRDRKMNKISNVILEYIISFFKQFIKPVSIEEYNIMRASFMLTHRRTANFVFMDYIMSGLDDDFSEVSLCRALFIPVFPKRFPDKNTTDEARKEKD